MTVSKEEASTTCLVNVFQCLTTLTVKIFHYIQPESSPLNMKPFSLSYHNRSAKESVTFFLKIFCNLETYSEIPLSKQKAQVHIFCFSQDCILPAYENAYNYLPQLVLALYCILSRPWFQPRQCQSHTNGLIVAEWCVHTWYWTRRLSGEELMPWWYEAGGGLQYGLGQGWTHLTEELEKRISICVLNRWVGILLAEIYQFPFLPGQDRTNQRPPSSGEVDIKM